MKSGTNAEQRPDGKRGQRKNTKRRADHTQDQVPWPSSLDPRDGVRRKDQRDEKAQNGLTTEIATVLPIEMRSAGPAVTPKPMPVMDCRSYTATTVPSSGTAEKSRSN